jgi:hypothetical protein
VPRLLLIDTNLLLVAVVAAIDPHQVGRVGRTRAYTVADTVLLESIVAEHDNILVTPHILTEVSNLLGKVDRPLLFAVRSRLAALVTMWSEIAEPSKEVLNDPFFQRFGMTDAAISRVAGPSVTILTDDLPLYDALGRRGYNVINFTHVRAESWRETDH